MLGFDLGCTHEMAGERRAAVVARRHQVAADDPAGGVGQSPGHGHVFYEVLSGVPGDGVHGQAVAGGERHVTHFLACAVGLCLDHDVRRRAYEGDHTCGDGHGVLNRDRRVLRPIPDNGIRVGIESDDHLIWSLRCGAGLNLCHHEVIAGVSDGLPHPGIIVGEGEGLDTVSQCEIGHSENRRVVNLPGLIAIGITIDVEILYQGVGLI